MTRDDFVERLVALLNEGIEAGLDHRDIAQCFGGTVGLLARQHRDVGCCDGMDLLELGFRAMQVNYNAPSGETEH